MNSITNTPGNPGQPPPGYIKVPTGGWSGRGVCASRRYKGPPRRSRWRGQVVALDGDNGTAKNPHVHVGAYRGKKPLQIRWDLVAEGRIQTLAHPQQQPHP